MRVLGIDTSTLLGSVACVVDGELRSEVAARVRARHGETVFTLLEQVLDHAGVARGELDLVTCGLGPGSFTGTRVGVAAAKGLALALDVPVVGVSTLRALALGAPGERLAPIVDGHKGEVFVALYERGSEGLVEVVAPAHGTPEAMRALLEPHGLTVFGAGARLYPAAFEATLPPLFDAPRAALVALEGASRYASAGPDDRATLEPIYLRASDAKLPGT